MTLAPTSKVGIPQVKQTAEMSDPLGNGQVSRYNPMRPSVYNPDDPDPVDIMTAIRIDRLHFYEVISQIPTFRAYARGKCKVILTDEQKAILRGVLDNDFDDNVCNLVIGDNETRLTFKGWTVSDPKGGKDVDNDGDKEASTAVDEQAFANQFYNDEELASKSGEVHYDALQDGDHAVAIGWDADEECVELYREQWWDGYEGVFIAYDRCGEAVYAVKEWHDYDGNGRRNVWFEDRLERYVSSDGIGWNMTNIPDDFPVIDGDQVPFEQAQAMPWVEKDGTPLGIPIVHFPNKSRGSGYYGMSEIAGGVIGFQDQINDLQYAMTGAGRLTAYQMYWISGIKLEDDPNNVGKKKPLNVSPGQVLTSPNPATQFGVLPAGSLDQLINLHNAKLRSVARMTRTPIHSITGGDWPSGEALIRAERPAVGKAERQIVKFKDCWNSVLKMAIRVSNAFGNTTLREDVIIDAVYDTPDKRDLMTKSIVVKNLEGHISNQEALRIIGYSDAAAEKIQTELEGEMQHAADLAMAGFNKGTGPGTSMPGKDPGSSNANGGPKGTQNVDGGNASSGGS